MNRTYTEAELRMILERAVEDGRGRAGNAHDGLSLNEIKEIGAEVGIDPVSLARAAGSIEPARGTVATLAGGPTALSFERRVEGDLSDVPVSEILSVIRRGMGSAGELSELDTLLEWRNSGELGHRTVTLSTTDGNTTVSGMADLTQAAVVTHLPVNLLGLMGSGIGFMTSANNGHALGMVFFAALAPSVWLAARAFFSRVSKSEGTKLERVVEQLTARVGDSRGKGSDSTGAS